MSAIDTVIARLANRSEQWFRVALAVVAWVGCDLLVRLILRIVMPDNQTEALSGVITFGVLALFVAGWTGWRLRDQLVSVIAGEALLAAVIAAVLITVVGPFVSGGSLEGGWFLNLGKVLLAAAIIMIGVGLGLLVGVAFGADARSRGLRNYAARRSVGRR